jgi:hypothetical protein
MDEEALEQVPQCLLGFSLLIIIPPSLHTHISPSSEVSNTPDQAAHYHILKHPQSLSLRLHL